MLYFHLSIVPVAPFLLWDCMQKRPKRLHHTQQIRLHHYDILLPRYDHLCRAIPSIFLIVLVFKSIITAMELRAV